MTNIAVIGCGFSGLSVLSALVRKLEKPCHITIYEPSLRPGLGKAYSTQDPAHLLNVRAAAMGAYEGQDGDFLTWLKEHHARDADPAAFMPRALYGRYLDDVFAKAIREAQARSHRVFIVHEKVKDVTRAQNKLAVHAADDTKIYDAVIVANGNSRPRQPQLGTGVADHKGWWASPYKSERWPDIQRAGHIVILGSGLSMIDALVTLQRESYDGDVTVLSPHARIPHPHAMQGTPFPWAEDDIRAVRSIPDFLRRVRAHANRADWRDVLDGMRPYSNLIWRGFTAAERKRARRYMHMWNVCRHRIPAEMHELVCRLEQNQILMRREAAVSSVEAMGSSLVCRTSAGVFEAQIVMNCMGYDYRIDPQGGGLLPALVREGLIGLEDGFPVPVDDTCRLNADVLLYGIGPLWQGYMIESSAVREIRFQADKIAETLPAVLRS